MSNSNKSNFIVKNKVDFREFRTDHPDRKIQTLARLISFVCTLKGEPTFAPKEIIQYFEIPPDEDKSTVSGFVSFWLKQMVKQGYLRKLRRGLYQITKKFEELEKVGVEIPEEVKKATITANKDFIKKAMVLLMALSKNNIQKIWEISPELAYLIELGMIEIRVKE